MIRGAHRHERRDGKTDLPSRIEKLNEYLSLIGPHGLEGRSNRDYGKIRFRSLANPKQSHWRDSARFVITNRGKECAQERENNRWFYLQFH